MNIIFHREVTDRDALIVTKCERCIGDVPCGKPAAYILRAVPHNPSVCAECLNTIRRFDNPLREEPIQ